MIKLEQYKEAIHKCSKCGLCQEVCPVYRENGNECSTARGILILLKGLICKELNLRKESTNYVDLCLRCGRCSRACPSEIPFEEIIFAVKRKELYSTFGGVIKRIKQSEFVINHFVKPKKIFSKTFDKKVVYVGANSQAAVDVLNHHGIEVLNSKEQNWGLEYLLTGNIVMFRKNFRLLVKLLIDLKPEFIVADIPAETFKNLVKTYTNHEFHIKILYLGTFEGGENLVAKFYNPVYAEKLISEINLKTAP